MSLVIFACVHNAGRSQIACAWFNHLAAPSKARAISAGTSPATQIHPVVLEAMNEVGIHLTSKPQLLTTTLMESASHVVTMGCGEACPVVPVGIRRLDWPLTDPKDQALERVREIRDHIRALVLEFIYVNNWQAP